jgi:hypothetical protein
MAPSEGSSLDRGIKACSGFVGSIAKVREMPGVWIPASSGITHDLAYAARTVSRISPSVSSIITALTSRWVQARIRPSIIASSTPR